MTDASCALGSLQTDWLSILVEQRFFPRAALEHAWSVAYLSVDQSSNRARLVHWDHVGVETARERGRQARSFLSATMGCIDALAQKVELYEKTIMGDTIAE